MQSAIRCKAECTSFPDQLVCIVFHVLQMQGQYSQGECVILVRVVPPAMPWLKTSIYALKLNKALLPAPAYAMSHATGGLKLAALTLAVLGNELVQCLILCLSP